MRSDSPRTGSGDLGGTREDAAPSTGPGLCPECGQLLVRHTTIVRGPHVWACYLDGERPDGDDSWIFDQDEGGAL